MINSSTFPPELSQNEHLPIRIVSPDFGHLYGEEAQRYQHAQRLSYYFFLFVINGSSHQKADLEQHELVEHDLFFLLPNQIRNIPETGHGKQYFKLGFDQDCLARLPKQYAFLLAPLDRPKIKIPAASAARMHSVFLILQDLLIDAHTDPELILAHLHSLLTEIDAAYFADHVRPADVHLEKYLGFQVFVERNLTEHHTIKAIAEKLAVSTDTLNTIVKQFSGLTPKEFITNRLILEARRRMHYGKRVSVKQLAFDLGFNDPDYFNRVFKKITGKTAAEFFRDLS